MLNLKTVFEQTLASLSIMSMVLQPALAQTIAPATGGPTITAAQNGVAVVIINTPDGNGVSHNQYTDFNVGPNGLILNNIDTNLAQTQLGGLIAGNDNLVNGSASLIINEVTGTGRSALTGYLEVGGARADVIVANPNGITCHGCGFINTDRMTLTTGTPVFGATGFTGLNVNGGDIAIGANGANALDSTRFELLSRQITIAGAVQGQQIRVVAGRNNIMYATGVVTELAANGTAAPALAIDSTVVGGMYANAITLNSTEDGVGVRAPANMASSAGQMIVTADGRLVMGRASASGTMRVQSTRGDVVVEDSLSSTDLSVTALRDLVLAADAKLVSASALSLQAGRDVLANARSEIAAGGSMTATAGANIVLAEDVRVLSYGDVSMSANTIRAAQDALIVAGAAGGTAPVSGTRLSLNGATRIDLNGATIGSGGQIVITTAILDIASDGAIPAGQIISDGHVDIEATTVAATDASIRSDGSLSLHNAGGNLTVTDGRWQSLGNLDMTGQSIDLSGDFESLQGTTRIIATAGTITNMGLLAGQGIDVQAATALMNGGDIQGAQLTSLQAVDLNNTGTIQAWQGHLNAVVTNIQNSGSLFGRDSARLIAGGTVTNSGAIRSDGWLTLAGSAGGTAPQIDNQTSGEIIAGGDLIIDATSILNAGALASEQARLLVSATQDITNANTGLLFGKTLLQMQADGVVLNDGGTLLSQGNLVVAGLAGAQAGQFINRNGGLVESTGGDINIAAAVFENSRIAPTVLTTQTQSSIVTRTGSCSGTARSCTTKTAWTRIITEHATFSGNASQIISSGNINLNLGTGRNAYSLISAQGDVNLSATMFSNEGLDLRETIEKWSNFHHHSKSGWWTSGSHSYWTVNNPTVVANIGAVFATIEAGGAINGSVTGYLQNGAVQSGTTSTTGTGTTPGYTTANVSTSTLAPLNNSLAGLTGSSVGNSGLVVPVTTPNAPFLLETRFEFVNLENFLSSDYFLGEFDIDPNDLEKRLGDAYVETLFIREQLFGLTGQRLLNGAIDERAQMKAMYDNAINAASNLDLAFGVALTPKQIAALTEDIIWLEDVEIDGQMVLVPHVYLANAETLAGVGLAAKFVARDISILAGEFVNSGTLTAQQSLQVASLGDFRNMGGSLISGGDLSLDIAGTLRSVSGDIRGRNVAIAANEIVIETAALTSGRSDATAQTAARRSSITATQNLTLQATGDLVLTGAKLNAGGDTALIAGGDLVAGALALETHADMTFDGGYYRAEGIENVVTTINGGGDILMVSTGTAGGGDLILEGAQVAATGALTLRAEQGDVILAAAQDMFSSDLRGSGSGFLSKSESRDQVFDLSHQVVSLSASTIGITASGSVLAEGTIFAIPGTLDGVSGAAALASRDLIITAAGGDLTFAAVTDTHAESHFESSSFLGGLGGSMYDLKTLETTAIGARADIAGDIRLRSAGDLTLTAVDFKVGGQFSTEVAGATRVLAAVDTSYRSLSEMNNNMIIITTLDSEDYTESATFSSIQAAGGVDFDVTSDVTLGGVRDQLISGQHASQLLQDGDHGMAIAASYLGKTDPSTGPPSEDSTSDASNWRDDLNVTVAALPTGEDGAGYLYLDGLTARDGTTIEAITLIDEHFFEETKALSPAFKALVTIVLTQGIGGLGGFASGFGEMIGLSQSWAVTAANAFASNLAVGVVDGAVSGNFDLGELVKNATFAAISAGASSGLSTLVANSPIGEFVGDLSDDGLLGIGNENFSVQGLVQGSLDSVISAGVDSAVYGSDFGDGLLSEISSSFVNLAMADVQGGIGDLYAGGASGGEGSFGHISLHALTGCIAAEAQGASCASGAAAGLAQGIYAGTNPSAGTLTDDQIKNRAELIGGIAGFFASEGKAENVSTAASIARSGVENNYLSHQESEAFKLELLACALGDKECFDIVSQKYILISQKNNLDFENCIDDVCRAWHYARIEAAEFSDAFNDVYVLLEGRNSLGKTNYAYDLEGLQYNLADDLYKTGQIDDAARIEYLRDEISSNQCGGTIASCDLDIRKDLFRATLLNADEASTLIVEVRDEIHRQEEVARDQMRADVCGTARGANCETMVDAEIEASRKLWNRVEGGIDAAAGLLEVGGASYICGQSLGAACIPAAALGVHGLDTYNAGWGQLTTGEKHLTVGATILMETFGLSETTAALIYDAAGLTAEIGAAKLAIKSILSTTKVIDNIVPNTGPVRIGETTTFGDSTKRSVVGDVLTGDHMPSRAALQSRVEADIGRPLTQAEATKLRNSTGCVIVSGGGHCALSNTFGGRNTPSRISNDAANPRAAADADFDAMIPDFQASGMTSAQINAARTRLHNLNGTIIDDLNTQFGTQIRY